MICFLPSTDNCATHQFHYNCVHSFSFSPFISLFCGWLIIPIFSFQPSLNNLTAKRVLIEDCIKCYLMCTQRKLLSMITVGYFWIRGFLFSSSFWIEQQVALLLNQNIYCIYYKSMISKWKYISIYKCCFFKSLNYVYNSIG